MAVQAMFAGQTDSCARLAEQAVGAAAFFAIGTENPAGGKKHAGDGTR
jgi:hypothetical protein